MLTKLDQKKRSKGIGSSEIGMIIYVEDANGDMKPLSPYGGKHKLWRRKTGKEPEQAGRDYMRRGQYLEPALINWFCDDKEIAWYKPPTINHPDYYYVVDSVDGLSYPKGTSQAAMKAGKIKPLRCIEAKVLTGWAKEGFGDEGTDEIPETYLVQSQWHIGAHKPEEMACDFPVDVDGRRRDYLVQFDEELYLALVMEAEKFWVDYVEKDVEPPVDDYADTTSWLSRYLKQKQGVGLLEADEEQVKLLLKYREMALKLSDGEAALEEVKEKLMRAIGEYDGIVIPGTKQKVLWKMSKDSKSVDWKVVAEGLAQRLMVDGKLTGEQFTEIQEQHVKVRQGSRRWTPTSLLKNDAGNGAKKE